MANQLGQLIRRVLPPRLYKKAITYWRYRLYWQQSISSTFIKRRPAVEVFRTGNGSDLLIKLQSINVLAPTAMCSAMLWCGSDKSLFRHNYTTVYNALLGGARRDSLQIFELGLGSNNSQFAFNMWAHGVPGASLRGWKTLFPRARIFGADIDRASLFQEDRIYTTYCDQLDRSVINEMWKEPGLSDGMDLIIDDGLHTFDGNVIFLDGSLDRLRPGGFYVIEDIARGELERWRALLSSEMTSRYPGYEFAIVQLPNPYNKSDNNLIVIHRWMR